MADFEKIDIDPFEEEARYERPDFAKVVFQNVAETYPTDAHISCRYVVTSELFASSRDWVGLYKVGWSSSSDYVYFLWSPLPAAYEAEKEFENTVLFQGHTLPKDDGEFYQFCYVSNSGHVRGASTPFQFKRPGADDFIAIEDDEEDMMVVKSRTVALEDDLAAAVCQKESLQKKYELLEEEREILLNRLLQMDQKCQTYRKQHDALADKFEVSEEEIQNIQIECNDLSLANDALKEKLGFLEQEKASILKRLDENEQYISSLQAKIKTLINEKDALTGQCKTLEQEKGMLQDYFTNAETNEQTYKRDIIELKEKLAVQEQDSEKNFERIKELESEVAVKMVAMNSLAAKTARTEQDSSLYREQLVNAEDKLAAADNCMKLRREEINALQQAYNGISKTLETAKNDAHMYKTKLEQMTLQYDTEHAMWAEQSNNLLCELEVKEKEKSYLNSELEQATSTLESLKGQKDLEREGSLYALRKAHQHLRDQYSRALTKLSAAEKQLQEISVQKKTKEDVENDLRHEIRDLKERLKMGADEYKYKYLECRKLQADIRKLRREARRTSSDRGSFGPIPGRAEPVLSFQRSSSVGTESSLDMPTQTDRQPEVEITTQTETNTGAEMTTQTDRPSQQTTQTEKPVQCAASMCTEEWSLVSCTQTEKPLQIAASVATDNQSGTESTTQTEHYDEAEITTQTVPRLEAETTTQTERKLESEGTTQTDRKTELTSMTQTEIRVESDTTTQTEGKVEVEITTQTEDIRGEAADNTSQTDETSSASQIQCELDDFGLELESRFEYHRKIEKMYADEKSKNGLLQKIYHEELAQKDKLITSLLKKLKDQDGDECMVSDTMRTQNTLFEIRQRERLLVDTVRQLDPLVVRETEEDLQTILTPLPPPMQPELTPAAKLAACRRAISEPGSAASSCATDSLLLDDDEMLHDASSEFPIDDSALPQEEHEPDEERFEDADGEPQKLCPVCYTTFPADLPQTQFEQHVDSHSRAVCPMCQQQFPVNFEQSLFEEHVNTHFEDV